MNILERPAEYRGIENCQSEDSPTCRICYENSSEHLITPCKCQGTLGFAHEYCLQTWITEKFQDKNKAFCEICRENYKIQLNYTRSFKKIENENTRYCFYCKLWVVFFFLILSGVLTGLVFLFYVDFKGKPGYSISLVCCCAVTVMFHICLIIKIVICNYYVKSVKSWTVLSAEKREG